MNTEIMGIIDDRGCVHSIQYDASQRQRMHDDVWPMRIFSRWRWTKEKGITQLLSAHPMWLDDPFGVEQMDKIRQHLEREYGLKLPDDILAS